MSRDRRRRGRRPLTDGEVGVVLSTKAPQALYDAVYQAACADASCAGNISLFVRIAVRRLLAERGFSVNVNSANP